MKLHLHHHSFAYLNSRCLFTHILLGVAGSSSLNIALSERMADRMKMLYMTKQTVTISNAVFILHKKLAANTPRKELKTIGFIGNISVEKGVLEFFDLMILIETEKFPLQAKMAGNFEDYRVKSFVKKRLEKMQKVEYIGPKYGIDKDDFFNLIDVLVLPTRYVNEAEPLVILEAMSSGVPVIAYGRGCIPEVVGNESGLVIDTNEDFAPVALEQIKAWLGNPRSFESASKAAADRFIEQYSENKKRWLVLLNSLFG